MIVNEKIKDMKKTMTTLFMAVLVILGVTSCKKYLGDEPKYLLTPEIAVYNEASAQAILYGAYSFIGKDEWTARFTGGFSSMLGTITYNSSAGSFDMGATGDNEPLWTIFYKTINAANAAITSITALDESAFSSAARKKELLGEAYCIRAFAHTYAFWYFGRWWDAPESKYGVLYRDKVSDLTNVYQARLTVGESYAKIISDLDYAIANAPEYSSTRRMSKQFAQALKAKLLLYRGTGNDNKDALDLVNLVMNKAEELGLKIEPSLTSLYDKSWDSKELLFCRYRETTDNIISAYNFTYGYNYATLTLSTMGKALLESDPRYPMAWGLVKSPIANNNTYTMACKKLCRKGRQEGGDNDKYTTYFLRYTELYFMKAELLVKTGATIADGVEYINKIRRRSNLQDTTVTTPAEFNNLLFKELYVELHMENEADWMAAVRIRDASDKRMIFGLRGPAVTVSEDRFVWPIPTSEMRYNTLLIQNPSYEHLSY